MKKVYHNDTDIFNGLPEHSKEFQIGHLIENEIEKLKAEGRFYLSDILMAQLKQSMEIAKLPKSKNINQIELF